MERKLVYFSFFILFFRLGQTYLFSPQISFKAGDKIILKACLDNQPQSKKEEQTFYLKGIKVITSLKEKYSFGDCLRVRGEVDSYQWRGKTVFYLENPKINKLEARPLTKSFGFLKGLGLKLQDKAAGILSALAA